MISNTFYDKISGGEKSNKWNFLWCWLHIIQYTYSSEFCIGQSTSEISLLFTWHKAVATVFPLTCFTSTHCWEKFLVKETRKNHMVEYILILFLFFIKSWLNIYMYIYIYIYTYCDAV